MLIFHVIGEWRPEQVFTTWMQSARRVLAEVEAEIDRAWEAAHSRPGIKLFDGPMCRMESWKASPDALRIALSPTSYKPFFGTNISHPDYAERFGREVMANPVGVSPALETADGFLMLGRRSKSLAYYPGRVHPFAGALEPRDSGDLFAAVRRELAEELSLQASQITEIRCCGIVEDLALRQPELIFRACCTLTRPQIEAQIHADEHHGGVAVAAAPDAVAAAAGDAALTPVAVACLLLWGRHAFGEEWFQNTEHRSQKSENSRQNSKDPRLKAEGQV